MNSLSDYVLSMLIRRCSLAGMFNYSLRERSYRVKRHLTLYSVCDQLNRYQNIQHVSLHDVNQLRQLSDTMLAGLLTLRIRSINTRLSEELKRCNSLQVLRLHKSIIDMNSLATLYLPPTLTELDCVIVAKSLEEASQKINEVTLPCPIRVRCESQVEIAGKLYVGRSLFHVDTDKTFRLTMCCPRRVQSTFDTIHPSYSHLTLERVVISELTTEWLKTINTLPNLLHVTIAERTKPEALYSITTSKLVSLTVAALPTGSKLLVYKLPSTLKRLDISRDPNGRGRQSSLYFGPIPALKVLITDAGIETLLPPSLQELDAIVGVDLACLAGCSELRALTFAPEGDIDDWPESLVTLRILHSHNRTLPRMPLQLPKHLRMLWMYTPQVSENVTKWSLAGLDLVHVEHALTEEQLHSFTGYALTSANTERRLDQLRHSQRKRIIKRIDDRLQDK